MVDKIDILSNFDIDNNLSDCTSDENLSDLSLSDTSSENSFEECNNDGNEKNSDSEMGIFKREIVEYKPGVEIDVNCDTSFNAFDCKSDNASVRSEKTFSVGSAKTVEATPRSENAHEIHITDSSVVLNNKKSEEDFLNNDQPDETSIFNEDEGNMRSEFLNDEFSQMEKSLPTDFIQYLESPKPGNIDSKDCSHDSQQSKEASVESQPRELNNNDSMTPDEKRFQNLQDEINLLNILMYEAENQTEKCGSLYNSFTNEINNSLSYSKTGVSDDCGGSLASLVDGSKFDAISVKSELLFSDYGKSESNFDASETPEREKGDDKHNLDDVETKSVASSVQAMSVDTNCSECKTCKDCEADKTDCDRNDNSLMADEDRIIVLWNQIIRLKCTLKNLQLSLKEQQMETLMQINEFLINQSICTNHMLTAKAQSSSSSCTLFDRNKESRSPHENLSDTSLIFTENNKVREDIALNNLKIALIECNMLSSTASSLVDNIPKFENSDITLSKSKLGHSKSSKSCCCEQIEKRPKCLCPLNANSYVQARSKLDRQIKSEHLHRIKRQPFANPYSNSDDKSDRKVKSHEEILNKFPEATKYCLSEVRLDEISPRVCV